jgi:hypothetical protein
MGYNALYFSIENISKEVSRKYWVTFEQVSDWWLLKKVSDPLN